MATALFSKVLIISSLPATDNQTAKDLYDWLEALKTSRGWSIQLEYQEIDNQVLLLSRLEFEAAQVERTGIVPIIHIEAHGTKDEDGIELKDGSELSWKDLHPALVKLNIATKLNVLLVLGLCSGAHFASHLVPSDRAPCWLMVGPKTEVEDLHLRDRFKDFYRETLTTGDGTKALNALNEGSEYGEAGAFFSVTAELMFKATYRKYLAELTTDDECKSRAVKIRERLKGLMFPAPHQRELALMLMANKGALFEVHKKHFFMIDLWEEHEERFPVVFGDVIA